MDIDAARLHFQGDSLWLLNVIIGLIMFGVALDLRVRDFRAVALRPKAPLVGLLAQFIIMPAATFALTRLLDPPPSIALGMILVAACPGGNLSNFITHLAGGNTALSVSVTAVSSVVAIVMTPVNVMFWGGLHADTAALLHTISVDPLSLLGTVFFMLGLPLALGMAFAHRYPAWAARLHNPFKYFSIGFFLLFIALVFSQNTGIFINFFGTFAFAVILHNATAFLTGYTAARLAGLPDADCRAITIEVGIQNSALGLVLVFGFFDGLGGMAIIAGAWGIWHIVVGLSLAWWWSRQPALVPAEEAA